VPDKEVAHHLQAAGPSRHDCYSMRRLKWLWARGAKTSIG
jgi:hypothetical protein